MEHLLRRSQQCWHDGNFKLHSTLRVVLQSSRRPCTPAKPSQYSPLTAERQRRPLAPVEICVPREPLFPFQNVEGTVEMNGLAAVDAPMKKNPSPKISAQLTRLMMLSFSHEVMNASNCHATITNNHRNNFTR